MYKKLPEEVFFLTLFQNNGIIFTEQCSKNIKEGSL